MSRTPETIIIGWRKALHDLFAIIAVIAGLVALVSFLVGGNWFLALVVFILSAYTSSNIKFKLVKKVEVGGFELE
jgi:uncharacterized membrane protein